MITIDNLVDLLDHLRFSKTGNEFTKYFSSIDAYLKVDFAAKKLVYPEDKGFRINERQTCNFSANENFVVFEAVHRLFEKGYKPEHIELEPKWPLGHGSSGGRADILVKDSEGKPLLIIECKTPGKEFYKSWKQMLVDGGQLFSYAQQERTTKYICLYTSDFNKNRLIYDNYLVVLIDNEEHLKGIGSDISYRNAKSTEELFKVWKEIYAQDYLIGGVFEDNIPAYKIGKSKYTINDLRPVESEVIRPMYHEFATILRQHNVSGRENAFDKLVNLFLCKIVDEIHNPHDLQFYWKGVSSDSFFDLIDRLQRLYRDGMMQFLREDVTYIDNQSIHDAFKFFKNDPDATRDKVFDYFRRQKYFTNNDFSFIDVHNEYLFHKNAVILLKVVQMLQGLRLTGNKQHNQFLGDMFEFFLDQGFKQTEGQFFTPLPIVRFILKSLPLSDIIENYSEPPKVVDYACGAGHFLTELASSIKPFIDSKGKDYGHYYASIYGIEKEYRLSKVAKVSTFMYGQGEINIIYGDALAQHEQIKDGSFHILLSNPPYSVKGFLETLPKHERDRYELAETVDEKNYSTNNGIEAFFIERTKQLLAPGGIASIIVPVSVLSTSDKTHIRTREILLRFFDIVALVELPSGTFGKTGTSTITLFLRRKDENPAPADHYRNRVEAWFGGDTTKDAVFQDEHLLKAYCDHIGVSFKDYCSLLAGKPNHALLDSDIFKAYRQVFDDSAEIKNLKKRKSFKEKPLNEQKKVLDERFLSYLHSIEKDKAYYFLLTYTQPNQVVVVRSPRETSKSKVFLGYEWSNRRGNEGIKLYTDASDKHVTPLYDPDDNNNPQKISYFIQRNFIGETPDIPDTLREYVSYARLVDLIDFGRVKFDKQISLAPKIVVTSRYPLVKLGEICTLFKGVNYNKSDEVQEKTKNAVLTADNITLDGYLRIEKVKYLRDDLSLDAQAKLRENDIFICMSSGSRKHLGKSALINEDLEYYAGGFMGILRVHDTKEVLPKYICEVLNSETIKKIFHQQSSGSNIYNLSSSIMNIKIPVPPLDIQQKIVVECQSIDNEMEEANSLISKIEKDIQELFKNSQRYATREISLGDDRIFDIFIGKRVLKKDINSERKGLPVFSANVFEPLGYIEKQFLKDFSVPSVLWGIDGDWMVRFIPPDQPFYPTDHCGVIRVKQSGIVCLRYLAWALEQAGADAGFSRSFRASIDRIKRLKVRIPSIDEQISVSEKVERLERELFQATDTIASAKARKRSVLKKYL